MKQYKTPDGSVWAFEADGSQDALIKPDMAPMTAEEVAEHQKPAPITAADRIRKVLLQHGETRLTVQLMIEVCEDKARALGAKMGLSEAQALAYAYSKNKAYRTCKDLEAAIQAIERE